MEHPEIPRDNFANRLLLARRHRGLTVKAAAAKCGLDYGSWSNWERGMNPQDQLDVIEKVSAGLGIDRLWLAFGGALDSPTRAGKTTEPKVGQADPAPETTTPRRYRSPVRPADNRPNGGPRNTRRPALLRRPSGRSDLLAAR